MNDGGRWETVGGRRGCRNEYMLYSFDTLDRAPSLSLSSTRMIVTPLHFRWTKKTKLN